MKQDIIFLTVATPENEASVRLLIRSLRTFGGELSTCPFWVFSTIPARLHHLQIGNTQAIPLMLPSPVAAYPYVETVTACARAEELAPARIRNLVWVDPAYLFVQPPTLLDLDETSDAAFRPVHIRNVGMPAAEPLDAFWQGIYNALGVQDISSTVTSFIDSQNLRSYFNSHAFAVRPALGLMCRWEAYFHRLAGDKTFQSTACTDPRHPVFLFQAILSALVVTSIKPGRLRILPPTYNYPYNLQARVPAEQRAAALNELVSFTYEDRSILPGAVIDIEMNEPLRSWLEAEYDPCNQA
jgi:hypothetical protein